MSGPPRPRATFHVGPRQSRRLTARAGTDESFSPRLRRGILSLFTLTVLFLPPNAVSAETAAPNTLSQDEIDDGWILLFDGQTDFGWKAASKANWKIAEGVISVSEGEKGLLCTTSEFDDYVLKVDFRAPRIPTAASSCARPPNPPTRPPIATS